MNQDTNKKSPLQIVPRSPILSSLEVSDLLRVEQHRQPVKGVSECCLPNYLLSIHLGQPILLERIAEGRRSNIHLTQGDIMITPPDLHRKLSWNTDAEFLLLRLEPSIFVSTVNETVELEHIEITPQLKIRDPLLQQIGLALKAELTANRLDRLYAESMANALAVHVLRRYSIAKPIIRFYSNGLPNHKLQQAIDYIQAHLAEDISLKAIATELGMSQYYFARLFKQSTGYSPYQYLIKCRIERAQELLTQTQQIANVALQVGFASQSQFGRHFKRLTGVTPKQFLMR
ncbi:helix-turn-helix domain-containing protein [Gloeocapsopsis dulcis]|uniref:AraC family transcriptional regulator n=1 Tax=Gloeocapsopsis dulcis AAB1 = 1H9 TaxID=1433147 RepID=A0A6N8FS37_9CHRO|nr:AraC family transcriptional regulator [Gloeocapsopsis dulcis]MUL35761.1 AraC family transcriptional regulator [Gloeocapsopsis dulcis AAB1 = 1H9]WNN90954.1 AraC family transcriptional regulator [Gloeocapsopsis dulcis]